ncbi:hypothetical protein IWQ57_002940 [Coemansia nantahalensis]|uniref:Uncharacterized protein n=2 Tax=Coemansia TaxID=4863 RepID=A0ACC1JYY8_9FUNG|nr:hypothetical protein IWQ57_002940 [Coemansia nantahalensis]
MLFSRQERLLRISKDTAIAVHIYLQECNVAWFADSLLQEVLQAVKPRLQDKIAACKKGTRAASVFANRAFQVAYYVDRTDEGLQVLLQEPVVKSEDADARKDGSEAVDASQFDYTALRTPRLVLVLVPEPFDANNPVAIPEALGVGIE